MSRFRNPTTTSLLASWISFRVPLNGCTKVNYFLVVYPGQRPRRLKIYQNQPLYCLPDLKEIMSNNTNINTIIWIRYKVPILNNIYYYNITIDEYYSIAIQLTSIY